MEPSLTKDQKQALAKNNGLIQGSSYILMSKKAFQKLLGLENNITLQASVAAVKEGLKDLKA